MKPFSMYVITDTHYFSSALGCRGGEYDKFMQFEQKCFAETQAINEAAFAWLEKADGAGTPPQSSHSPYPRCVANILSPSQIIAATTSMCFIYFLCLKISKKAESEYLL